MKKIVKTIVVAICSVALILPGAFTALRYNNTPDERMTVSDTVALCYIAGGVIAFGAGYSCSTVQQQAKQKIQIIHDRAVAYNLNRTNRLLLWLLVLTRILLSVEPPVTAYIMFCDAEPRYAFLMYIYLLIAITMQNIVNYFIGICINLHNSYISSGSCRAVYPQLILRKYIAGAVVLAVSVALNSLNVLASLLLLFIAVIPIVTYWHFSVKPYYKLFSDQNMRNGSRDNGLKLKTNFNDHIRHEPRLPALQVSGTEHVSADMPGRNTAQETSSPIKTTAQPLEALPQMTSDEARLAELEAELKKIPVAKVKKWYADGKLTDEQYKAIALKYNTLKKERDDIKERLELLKNI